MVKHTGSHTPDALGVEMVVKGESVRILAFLKVHLSPGTIETPQGFNPGAHNTSCVGSDHRTGKLRPCYEPAWNTAPFPKRCRGREDIFHESPAKGVCFRNRMVS